MLYFGTSGFSYEDWIGPFYPPGLPKREWLAYYARQFNALELNSTYYAIPRPQVMVSMVHRVGPNFLLTIKAPQDMTHQRQGNENMFAAFLKVIEPVRAEGKLGCILAQFPYSFSYNPQNLGYLEVLRDRLGDSPLVVEFRNVQWLKPAVFQWLKRMGVGFCCVDEPPLPGLVPPLAEATSSVAYVRFHGRNAAKWWHHQHAYERYDYTYSPQELAEWVPRIKKLNEKAGQTFVFGNNHFRGQSIQTIRQLRAMLD